jgi:hypothetical protein
VCNKCKQAREKTYIKIDERGLGLKIGRWILEDSRRSDKKKGLSNNLTREFIDLEISKGCSYCGEASIRMTLDRIDNTVGHLQSNVVPACIRCNLTRGNMPYKAWLFLVDSMRHAREAGAFDNWTGR